MPPTCSSGTDGSASTGRITPAATAGPRPSWPARPAPPRSWASPALPRRHRLVEQRTTSSSWSAADCATSASRIGYRRSSRRFSACTVNRRPTVARNRRRSAGSTDRSSGARPCPAGIPVWRPRSSPRPRSPPPPAVVNHASRVIPSPASITSSRSRSAHLPGQQMRHPLEVSSARARRGPCPTISTRVTAPGRITFADIRYSRRQAEQQRRRVMLHRPVQQKLLQLLHLPAPAGALFHAQVLRRPTANDPCGSAPAAHTPAASPDPGPAAPPAGPPPPAAPRPPRPARTPATATCRAERQARAGHAGPRPRPGSTNATSAGVT